jgi:hypothetical protein
MSKLASWTLILFAGTWACGPKDTIPDSPDHPASPAAPTGAEPPPPTSASSDAGSGDEHAGHRGAAAGGDGHAAHGGGSAGASDPQVIASAEQTALAGARPVLERHCAKCHTAAGKKAKKGSLAHFSMDAYPFGGHHAAELGATIREVLGASGKPATMPKDDPGVVQGAELETVLAWTRAFDAAHAAGLHQHEGEHGHGDHGAKNKPAAPAHDGHGDRDAKKKPAAPAHDAHGGHGDHK